MTKFKTENNTVNKDELINGLNKLLVNLIAFKLQVKNAHWNVRGIHFYQVHLLFDEIAEDVEGFVDKVAERITLLGGVAKGLVSDVYDLNTISEYPKDTVQDKQHLEILIQRLGFITNQSRKLVEETEDLKDPITADLYTEVCRVLDKKLWFLEAHLL